MKDKLYDFGQLGKWSAMTLKAQMEISASDSIARVPVIENKFIKQMNDVRRQIRLLGERRIKGKCMCDILDNIEEWVALKKEKDALSTDYNKYRDVLSIIIFGKKIK